MTALLNLFDQIINLYIWVIIASAVLSWLVAFEIINLRNRYVYLIADVLNRLTQPIYRHIRRFLPDMGGVDLSPLILILGLHVLRILMWELLGQLGRGY